MKIRFEMTANECHALSKFMDFFGENCFFETYKDSEAYKNARMAEAVMNTYAEECCMPESYTVNFVGLVVGKYGSVFTNIIKGVKSIALGFKELQTNFVKDFDELCEKEQQGVEAQRILDDFVETHKYAA